MKKKLLAGCIVTATALMVGGCSSSSDSSPSSSPSSPDVGTPGGPQTTPGTRSGQAMNTYLVGAAACVDVNFNGRCDSGEPKATTGAKGSYSIATENITAPTLGLLDDNELSSPAGSKIVSPITTLIHAQFRQHLSNGMNVTEALNKAVKDAQDAIGVQDVDLLNQDYVASADSTDEAGKVSQVASVINRVMKQARAKARSAAEDQGIDLNTGLNRSALTLGINNLVFGQLNKVSQEVSEQRSSGLEVNLEALANNNRTDLKEFILELATKLPISSEVLDRIKTALDKLKPRPAPTGGTGGTGGTGTT